MAPACSSLVRPVVYPASASVAANSANNAVTLSIAGGVPTGVAVSTQATHGTATASGISITYSPTSGYTGADSFQYTATNTAGTSSPATVSVTVNQQPPVANNVSATVAANSTNNPITLNITGGTPSSVAVSTQAAHGTATASGISITYSPGGGIAGADTFQYTATNSSGTSAPATASITVTGTGAHVVPTPTWTDITAYAQTGTATGSNTGQRMGSISQTITVQLTTVGAVGGGTLKYSKNGGAWTTWTTGVTISMAYGDTLAFQVTRSTTGASMGSIKVVNQSDSNTVLGQFSYDVEVGT